MTRPILLVAVLALGLALAQSGPDTYVYMTFGGIDTLDPEGSYDTASSNILENVYETLYAYDGESLTEFKPALATAHEIGNDGLTYTFTLREGVPFHSGNTLTCRDVEYSIERILVMNDPQSGVWFQAEALLGTASNVNDDASITWEMIDGAVECLDARTVRFTLPRVDPAFFAKLAYTNASVIDSAWAIENGEWDGTEATWRDWVGVDPREGALHDRASGTGAYRLIEWLPGEQVVAEAFVDYWGGAPAIRTVLIQTVDEEATRILALRNGDADRIDLLDWATVDVQVRPLEGVTVHESDTWASASVGAIHFNQHIVADGNAANVGCGELGCGVPGDFFADVDVRKGFAYSFDQQLYIDELEQGKGSVLTMALPPSFLGYDPTLDHYRWDRERAEAHFRAAMGGRVWEEGFTLTISYNATVPWQQRIMEIVKVNVEELNPRFRVELRGVGRSNYLSDRAEGLLSLAVVGWAPDYADPDNYLWTFYHSTGFYGRLFNFTDVELDTLLEDARTTTDPGERAALYARAGRRAFELAPTLPLPQQRPFIVTRSDLKGVYYNPLYGHEYLWKDIAR